MKWQNRNLFSDMVLKIFSPMFSSFFCGTQKVQDYCFSPQKSCMLFTHWGGLEGQGLGKFCRRCNWKKIQRAFCFLMLPLHSFNTISLLRFVTAVVTHLLFCIFLRFVLLFSNSIWTLPDSGERKKSTQFCLVVDALCFGLKSCKALLKKHTHTID